MHRLLSRRLVPILAGAVAGGCAASAASPLDEPPLPDLLSRGLRGLDALRVWQDGSTLSRLNRGSHTDCDPARRVLVVVGVTGAGKSSTANTLAGRTHKPFALSGSLTSVTTAVGFRDYTFLGAEWRVVDTPGLCDTNATPAAVRGELLRLARYAPHGVAAFVVVIPRGRFTPEQAGALRELASLFPGLPAASLLAVTNATDLSSDSRNLLPRDVLVDELNRLPQGHFLREFVEEAGVRLVPVENRIDAARQVSRMTLHQRALDVEAARGGARYPVELLLAAAEAAAAGVGAGGGGGGVTAPASDAGAAMLAGLRLGPCAQTVGRRASDGKLVLTVTCDVAEAASGRA